MLMLKNHDKLMEVLLQRNPNLPSNNDSGKKALMSLRDCSPSRQDIDTLHSQSWCLQKVIST